MNEVYEKTLNDFRLYNIVHYLPELRDATQYLWDVNHDAIMLIDRQATEIAQLRRELEEERRLLTVCEATLKYERNRADLNERAMRLMAHAYSFIPVDECIADFIKLAQEPK